MRKTIILSVTALVVFLIISILFVSAQRRTITETELRQALADRQVLNSYVNSINSALDSLPQQIRTIIGVNAILHVRIGTSNIGVFMSGGRVSQMTTIAPSNPNYYVDSDYNTILRISNSDNAAVQGVQEFFAGNIRILSAGGCGSDIMCNDNEVCISGACRPALTVVAAPLGYDATQRAKFAEDALSEIEIMKNTLPIDRNRVRVHLVDPSVCSNIACNDACGSCQNAAITCASRVGLASIADRIVAFSNRDLTVTVDGQVIPLCGCAAGIPSLSSVTRSRFFIGTQGPFCVTTAAHESGHTFGLYHVNSQGNEAGACLGPNAADCNVANKASDLMGYRRPRDHYGPNALSYISNLFSRYR